ncbi:MAG: hypothetical protein HQM10_12305 [Candidatus Riflebacteria bacterium]|nr:hypothetical protein [Candidatus Riflebacteria bacterium]
MQPQIELGLSDESSLNRSTVIEGFLFYTHTNSGKLPKAVAGRDQKKQERINALFYNDIRLIIVCAINFNFIYNSAMLFKNGLITILSSLRFNLVAIALAVSLIYLSAWTIGNFRLAENLAEVSLEKTGQTVESSLNSFFLPSIQGFECARKWAASGLFNPSDASKSVNLFLPMLVAYPQITSVTTGRPDGSSFRIGADSSDLLVRIIDSGESKFQNMLLFSQSGKIIREWKTERTYDPRTRQWYMDAVKSASLSSDPVSATPTWTDSYVFHSANLPGISLSGAVSDLSGNIFYMTFNMEVEKISAFSVMNSPSRNGKTFILSNDGTIIGLPGLEKFSSAEKRKEFLASFKGKRPTLADLKISLFDSLAKEKVQRKHTSFLTIEGKKYLFHQRPFFLSKKTPIWIGMIIPESDLLEEFELQKRYIAVISALIFISCWITASRLARWYSHPLEGLADNSERMTMLDLSEFPRIESPILEVNKLAKAHARMMTALDSFSKYVPLTLVRDLLQQGNAAKLEYKQKEAAILFTDIKNSTGIAETVPSEVLSAHLANYYENMMAIIQHHHGLIDKLVGDAIMALWGTPHDDSRKSENAVRAALKCRNFLNEFNEMNLKNGLPELITRFGIATGAVMAGNFGSPVRMFYTVIGDKVNLASRLEGLNKHYGTQIMVEENTKIQSESHFEWRQVDVVTVKGKCASIKIFELLGEKDKVATDLLEFSRLYEKALNAYFVMDYIQASEILSDLKSPNPNDLTVSILKEKVNYCLSNPPGENWNGISNISKK